MSDKVCVLMTGATGTVGKAFLRQYEFHHNEIHLKLLARDSKKNRKMLEPLARKYDIEIVWGDLTNRTDVFRAVENADYVLHVGGMVSPKSDYYPEKTMLVNVNSAQYIVDAVNHYSRTKEVRLVYTGSVSQLGFRKTPFQWGRSGDPVWGVNFDWYAHSKIIAERIVAESGIEKWVSLRLPGILAESIIRKGSDPIAFHVPLQGVIEWVTDEDVARALSQICLQDLPQEFWRNFYNVSSGPDFRLTNYEFMKRLLMAMSCPPPEKVFDADWFATGNFHGMWYEDSDELEYLLRYRSGVRMEAYFNDFAAGLPGYYKLASIVPSFIIKRAMKLVAGKAPFGPLYWRKTGNRKYLDACFNERRNGRIARKWEEVDLQHPDNEPVLLSHGYDENKRDCELCIVDMMEAAVFRGGRCLSSEMVKGDLTTPLKWQCRCGHEFAASPRLVIKGGHWCPECFHPDADFDEEAKENPFFAQIWKNESD